MPNDAYFQGNPVRLDTSRSVMTATPRWTGTFSTGYLVPIFCTSSIMPGDNFKMAVSSAIRLITPRFPTMDDLDISIEAYFVPHRLVLSRKSMSPDVNDSNHSWAAFIGAQDSVLNMPTPGDVKLPSMYVEENGYVVGGLADCLGFARPSTQYEHYEINPLKPLAYMSVWSEYFRDPNTMNPVTYSISSGILSFTGSDAGVPSSNSYRISNYPLAPVCRYHGYFGSALPWPQRNSTAVLLPLGADAPVVAGATAHLAVGDSAEPLKMLHVVSGAASSLGSAPGMGFDSGVAKSNTAGTSTLGAPVTPSNLYADLSQATAATVNQLRYAFATQRWYEALARCGNKYSDLVSGMYGVRDGRDVDRPEYLGGITKPINISQVANTASDLGATGAFSLSNPGGFLFSKGFTEHGSLLVVACVRCRESFSQGIDREDTRFDRFQYYFPQYANIGEQPVLNREIFVQGHNTVDAQGRLIDTQVFGYQEAWAEYRMFNDKVRGYANPVVSGSLEYATYCNKFSALPTLKGYLDASAEKAIVDRTMTTTSAAAGFQFLAQFGFQITMVRPMPLYSIPGLIDHH